MLLSPPSTPIVCKPIPPLALDNPPGKAYIISPPFLLLTPFPYTNPKPIQSTCIAHISLHLEEFTFPLRELHKILWFTCLNPPSR